MSKHRLGLELRNLLTTKVVEDFGSDEVRRKQFGSEPTSRFSDETSKCALELAGRQGFEPR